MSRIPLLCAVALAACDAPPPEPTTTTDEAELVNLNNCLGTEVPSHVAPTYARPADDSIVLQTLIDGAGYAMPSNSNWVDVAAGNLCGGPEKELVLLKNAHSNFSVMRGPVPYAVGSGDLNSDPAHPWRAVAVGKLGNTDYDEIVALRHISRNDAVDLVVARANPATCEVTTIVANAIVGSAANSDWVDVAIGNFDGTGKRIAMLKKGTNYLVLYKLEGNTLTQTGWSNLAGNSDWRGVAAADLDGDGKDELVVARRVTDGVSGTIFAFKLTGTTFTEWKNNSFGNTGGGSSWAGLAAGDFNGDGRASVVAVKNEHSNFAVFDVPPGGAMRVLATSDLDSATPAPWRGIVAVDWSPRDQGAPELVALRAPTSSAVPGYRTDLFVYGNSFHRAERDSALEGTKAVWDQDRGKDVVGLANSLVHTHTNTLQWTLVFGGEGDPHTDYLKLVEFLDGTKNLCIDGRRLRVWVTLELPPDPGRSPLLSIPADSLLTPFNEYEYFFACNATQYPTCPVPPEYYPAVAYDYRGWGSLIGRLATEYPQLAGVTLDDYGHHPERISEEALAEMQSRMRWQAPWLNLVPVMYTDDFRVEFRWHDLTKAFDSVFFFFRNELAGPICLANCATDSVPRLPTELAFMGSVIPAGRKLQLGTYWVHLDAYHADPDPDYDYRLMSLALEQPSLGGVSAYSQPPDPNGGCNDLNYLGSSQCALWKAYGAAGTCTPGEVEPCGFCGTRTCGSNFQWGACSSQGVCAPGTTRTTGCGDRCGVSTDTCSATCQWTPGTCGNEGICRAGETERCCPCTLAGCSCSGWKTCKSNCTWGPCLGATCKPNECSLPPGLRAPVHDGAPEPLGGTEPEPSQP